LYIKIPNGLALHLHGASENEQPVIKFNVSESGSYTLLSSPEGGQVSSYKSICVLISYYFLVLFYFISFFFFLAIVGDALFEICSREQQQRDILLIFGEWDYFDNELDDNERLT
jgi:hypothetical protein